MYEDGCRDLGLALRWAQVRRVAAILVFLVLALRAVVPAVPLYVCVGMGAAHLWQPCCPGAEEAELPALTRSCCKPEQGAAMDVALPPAKPGPVLFAQPVLAVPLVAQFAFLRTADNRLLSARAPPWPVGPPPPLRTILRI